MTKKIKKQILSKTFFCVIAFLAPITVLGQGQTIVYPDDNPGNPAALLQTVNSITNSLAPNGSSSGKSSSISDNSITLNSGSVGAVFGAININDMQTVANNSVFVTDGNTGSSVYGGYSSSGTIRGNTVNISGGSMTGGAYGGFTNLSGGTITGNTVNITDGKVAGDVVGGSSRWGSGNATDNIVNISGGSTGLQVFGGWSQNGNVSGNTVNISGGEIGWHVTGGYISSAGSATYNTITFSGSPTITGNINGGNRGSGTGDVFTGNTLNVWNYSGSSVWNVQNFEFFNFRIPSTQSGAVLTSSSVYLGNGTTGSKIAIEIIGAPLTVGSTITLIEATLTLNGFSQTTAKGGGYTFALSVEGRELIAKVTDIDTYNITAAAGSNGTITPNGTVNVFAGSDKTFTFSANSGFGIDRVFIDGVDDPAAATAGSYTFTNIMADHTIVVSFIGTTGIAEIESTGIKIYPNPVKDELRIESDEWKINRIEITDLSGKVIDRFDSLRNQINVSALSQGIYFLKFETDKGTVTKKFIKE